MLSMMLLSLSLGQGPVTPAGFAPRPDLAAAAEKVLIERRREAVKPAPAPVPVNAAGTCNCESNPCADANCQAYGGGGNCECKRRAAAPVAAPAAPAGRTMTAIPGGYRVGFPGGGSHDFLGPLWTPATVAAHCNAVYGAPQAACSGPNCPAESPAPVPSTAPAGPVWMQAAPATCTGPNCPNAVPVKKGRFGK